MKIMNYFLFVFRSATVVITLFSACSCGEKLTKKLPYETIVKPEQITGLEFNVSSDKFPHLLNPHIALTIKNSASEAPRIIKGRLNYETTQGESGSSELALNLTHSHLNEKDKRLVEVYDTRLLENYDDSGKYKSWDFSVVLTEAWRQDLLQIRIYGWTMNPNLK